MIKPLWIIYFDYVQMYGDSVRSNEIYVPGFDIGEAYQNGTRAVASFNYVGVTILRVERTLMQVWLEE